MSDEVTEKKHVLKFSEAIELIRCSVTGFNFQDSSGDTYSVRIGQAPGSIAIAPVDVEGETNV